MLTKSRVKAGRPNILHEPVQKVIFVEKGRLDEFAALCREHRISISEGIRQLMEQELEKKELGETNPINVSYIHSKNKPIEKKDTDIRDWLPRNQAIEMARKVHLNEKESKHLKETFEIIERKIKTGYL